MPPTRSAESAFESEDSSAKRVKVDDEKSTEQTSAEQTSTSTEKPAVKSYSAPNAGISEIDVGITQFLSPDLKGFKGILKQRYSDFLVNEIDKDGNVVHLTDTGFSDKRDRRKERREEQRSTDDQDTKPTKTPFELKPENREKLVSLLGEKTVNDMVDLLTNGSKVVTETPIEDKDDRTVIHRTVREAFESRLETRTTPENTFIITLSSGNNKFRSKADRLGKSSVGAANANIGLQKNFLHFTLYKENKETMQVANLLSKFLRVPPKTVTYAGTKDRRGVTVQRACISKTQAERLNGLNRTLRGIKLGGFKYEDYQLKLGDLKGNEFYITIRNVDEKDNDVINAALSSLRDNGFINYYGMQRFGTFSISTHTIGVHILKSDWETATSLILSPQELVIPESVEARKVWSETGDAKKALPLMPRKCVAEHSILEVLSETPNSHFNAVMRIPRNLRIMYGHAYQSYIWNTVASERIKRFGAKIIEGDLVLVDEAEKAAAKAEQAEEDDEDFGEEDVKPDVFVRARPVTKEEIESGKKTIFDVVLPTPGFDIKYPENELKQVYIDEMKKDGLDPDNMRRNIREFSLAGSYRYLLSRPDVVEWWIRKYDSDTEQMVKTDLDLLQEELPEDKRIIENLDEGSKVAVLLKIQLGTAQYATMALREVMKLDTKRRGDGLDVRNTKN
ncbi:uncharacterized protein SAPINGB_P001183 [Magnusiomyces paraingens]|uniref:TRUD domain-containing protein n=1 Tax=Magnusiomyces paraingens TaxID=2606893 RepID=A0A5E8B684_9ASCO|nr:uncharacterized protein SAPINGB_P001183 [Saprochaete ingens]VVT46377.1 unnamed protein product [Saprochaete ingens]